MPKAGKTRWRKVAINSGGKLLKLAGFLDEAETDVLAYMTFPTAAPCQAAFDGGDGQAIFYDRAAMTIAGIASLLSFDRAAGHSSVPAADLAATAPRVGQGWPRLRPPHGLALTGPSTAACWRGTGLHFWRALALTGGYGCRARATSWRSVMRRLQASPHCLFCPAELRRPRAGFWPPQFPLRHQSFVA